MHTVLLTFGIIFVLIGLPLMGAAFLGTFSGNGDPTEKMLEKQIPRWRVSTIMLMGALIVVVGIVMISFALE